MCGIFGVIDFKGKFKDKEIESFKILTNRISHRGPNSSGFYVNKDKNIFLGHRRLSILDLSKSGNQPLHYKNNTIIYNGEVFNFLDIKNSLQKKGVKFNSHTDTEVILKAIVENGIETISSFDGMWAFLIWDEENKRLIVSKDRFHLKPLYYLKKGNRIYFASEIKQLLPLLKSLNYNSDKVFKFLKQGLLDYDNETFFSDINRFPSGETWVFNIEGKIEKFNYWDYKPKDININLEDAVDIFREKFLYSIKKRLISDVPVSVLLSGGLDSSAISTIIKKHFNDKIKTFSIVSNEEKFSEKRYINILEDKIHLNNTKIYINYELVKNLLDKTLEAQDEPFGSMSVIAQFYLFKYIKENSDNVVIISGQGGDEILGGYLKYFFFFLKENIKKKKYLSFLKNIILSMVYRTVLNQIDLGLAKRYIPFMLEKEKHEFVKLDYNLEPIWEAKDFKDRQLKDIKKYSIPILARYEDRNSMFNSLEVRHPFLDYKLVEFSINLPSILKVNNGWLKYILRKAIYELPDEIRWRKDKQGFLIPQDLWIKNQLEKEIKNIISKDAYVIKENIVDYNKFWEAYFLLKNGNKSINSTDIFRVYILEKWFKKYF